MFRHIVLFQIYEDVPDGSMTAALAALNELANFPGLIDWRVELSLDQRKGRIVVLNACFASERVFQSYRRDPRHTKAAVELSQISDWWTADYYEDRRNLALTVDDANDDAE